MSILWQYRLWSLQAGGTKLERFLHKNQHTQRKLLNFENWISGGPQKLAKIRVCKVDYFNFSCKNIEELVWIRCKGNFLQLLGFWNFFVFFWFFQLKLVYFWTKSRKNTYDCFFHSFYATYLNFGSTNNGRMKWLL